MDQARRAFVEEQVAALEPFGVVLFSVPGGPEVIVEVERSEDGGSLAVAALTADPPAPEVALAAGAAGLDAVSLRRDGLDAGAAAALAERLLAEVLGAAEGTAVDVHHASRRQEVMVRRKMAAIRDRIGSVLAQLEGFGPWTVDADGDHTTNYHSTRLYVGPRALADGTAVVLVFSPTTVGVEPSPELGLYLVEANFHLVFGRFALDVVHGVVWFGHNLLGESFTDEELVTVVRLVAATSDTLDKEIAQRFGGELSAPEEAPAVPPSKPGAGGYL